MTVPHYLTRDLAPQSGSSFADLEVRDGVFVVKDPNSGRIERVPLHRPDIARHIQSGSKGDIPPFAHASRPPPRARVQSQCRCAGCDCGRPGPSPDADPEAARGPGSPRQGCPGGPGAAQQQGQQEQCHHAGKPRTDRAGAGCEGDCKGDLFVGTHGLRCPAHAATFLCRTAEARPSW